MRAERTGPGLKVAAPGRLVAASRRHQGTGARERQPAQRVLAKVRQGTSRRYRRGTGDGRLDRDQDGGLTGGTDPIGLAVSRFQRHSPSFPYW